MNTDSSNNSAQTFAAFSAIGAFTIWGLSPLFFKQLSHVPAPEVLANRIIWSFLLLAIVAFFTGQTASTREVLQNPRQRFCLLISALLISLNWLIFIWAVSNNHILDASLGYYLNPIFNVFLAMVFLKERLSRLQIVALLLACAAVSWQVLILGRLPLVSLVLAASFGFYGLIRKQIAVAAVPGLLLETMMILPLALGGVIWLAWNGQSSFGPEDPSTSVWLMLAGVMTSAPLLLFTAAAPKLRYVTLSFIQYLAPTLSLLVGVLIYGEAFGPNMQISFTLIWIALLFFTTDAIMARRKKKADKKVATQPETP